MIAAHCDAWEAVRRDGVHNQLVDLHRAAGLPDEVSPPRVLDAVEWMRAKNGAAL